MCFSEKLHHTVHTSFKILFSKWHIQIILKSQIIPLIVFNLLFGFTVSGIDNAAHIGGLIGGYLLAMAAGIKYRSKMNDKIHGIIMTSIYVVFLIIMCYQVI